MNLQKLKGKLLEKGITYQKASEHLDMSISTFSNKINGKSKLYVSEFNSLCELMSLTDTEILEIIQEKH